MICKTNYHSESPFFIFFCIFNEEREVFGRQKVVCEPSVPVLTSHVGLNSRSKSGYEREARVINMIFLMILKN